MTSAVQVIVDLQEKTHVTLLMARKEARVLKKLQRPEQEQDHKATFLKGFWSSRIFRSTKTKMRPKKLSKCRMKSR